MARDEVAGCELAQLGVLLEAGLCCVRAARGKAAAGLRVDGRGDLAAQNGALGRVVDIDARNGRKKRLGVGVQLIFEKLPRFALFHELSEVHDADVVGDVLDDGEVVRDEHVGEFFLLLQVHHQIQDLRLNGNVQRGNGLVADDELRLWRRPPSSSWG